MVQKNSKELYDNLLNTIKSLCSADLSDDEISDILEELEGDYYTFMHSDNIVFLIKDGVIVNDSISKSISELRFMIESIPVNMWNVDNYRNSNKWIEVRNQAAKVYSELLR